MYPAKRLLIAVLLAVTWLTACGKDGANYANPIDFAFGEVDDGDAASLLRAPSITGLSPDHTVGGAEVTVAGSGFGAKAGTVSVGGVAAKVSAWSAESLTFVVPLDVDGGPQPVVVRANGRDSKPVALSIAPSIAAVAPASGAAGADLKLSGANFGAAQGKSALYFGETAVTPTKWAARAVEAVVPATLRAGTQELTVKVGGLASAPVAFTLRPAVASIAPASGAAGTQVTLTGTSFGAEQGDGRVLFGSVAASVVSWSAGKIVVRVPVGAAVGAAKVTVVIDGAASNAAAFTVLSGVSPTPALTSLAPGAGFAGAVVTVTGTNFGATQGASTLSLAGSNLTPVGWSATQVQFTVPAGIAAGTADVVVTVGGRASNALPFALRPSLSTVAAAAAAGATVTLTGANFGAAQGGGAVRIGGLAAAVTAWSDGQISVVVPSLAAGAADVFVTQGGQASNTLSLTVVAPGVPALYAASPSAAAIGDVVSVSGANLGAVQGASSVTLGGAAAVVGSWSATGFTFTVPGTLAPGPANLVVTVGAQTAVLAFTVVTPTSPFLATISPAGGEAGAQVTVTGSHLGAAQGASTLTIGGVAAAIVSWSDAAVVAVVPPGLAAGSRAVQATVSGEASNTLAYAVVPVLTALTPVSGATGTSITLTGSGFGAAPQRVRFGSGDATVTGWSPAAVTAVVPGALAPGAYPVQVVVNGQATAAKTYTVTTVVSPAVTAVSPAAGGAGARVVVAGAGFGSAQGASTLTLGGVPLSVAIWSDGALYFDVPVTAAPGTSTLVVTAAGRASNAASFTVLPSITTVSPTGGPAGTRVTMSGANFGAAAGTLQIGGLTVTPVAWTNTAVTFDVPPGLAVGASVIALTAGGQPANAASFTVTALGAPVISALSPATGPAGATVTLTGAGFGAVQGASTLRFGGSTLSPASWSDASVSFVVPALAAGTYAVTLGVGGGTSNGVPFTLAPPAAPAIGAVTPAAGAPGATVVVTGTGFGAAQGASALTIGGVAVTPSAWSDTSLTAVVPASLNAGVQPVVVTVGGVASNTAAFTVRAAQLTAVTPASGAVGSAITVTGSGLGASQGASRLVVGGIDAAVNAWNDTSVDAVVPGSLGAGALTIVAWVGGQPSNALDFTVSSAAAPVITSLTPSVVSSGQSVTIGGSGFGAGQGASTVRWGGLTLPVVSWSNSSVVVDVPATFAAGTATVVVTVGGQASNAVSLTVVPVIRSAAPQALYAAGQVTLYGAGFGAAQGGSSLLFGSSTVTPSAWSPTAVTFSVPSVSAADYFVRVVVGSQTSNSVALTVLAPPTPVIASLTPAAGPVGTAVTLTGTNFGAVKGTSMLSVGGTNVAPTAWGATSISFTVPALADGSHSVVVTVGGLVSNTATFTLASPGAPVLSGVMPVAGTAGDSLTVTGSNFGAFQGASTLSLGGVPLAVLSWSDTSIIAAVPASIAAGARNLVATVSGKSSNALSFTVRPSLASLTPLSGPTGQGIVLHGTGFGSAQGASQVLIGGGAATVTGWSASAVTAVVPGGLAAGAVPVAVVVAGQSSNSRTFTVTATAAPVLAGVTPAGASGGALVTLTGLGFGSSQGSSTVTLGGQAITPTAWSDGEVRFVLSPTAAPGGTVLVVTVAGQASNALTFSVFPAIASVSPTGGPAGMRVSLTGTNFGSSPGSVSLGGAAATPAAWSATAVSFDVPAGVTPGASTIVVTAGGQPSNAAAFTVAAPTAPVITSLSPVSGSTGTSVTVAGAGFGAVQGASTLTFGASTITPSAWSDASLTFAVPAVAAGSYAVKVIVSGVAGNQVSFAVSPPAAPVVTSVTPASGAPGTVVVVAGTRFGASQGASTLTIGGVNVSPSAWDDASLTATVPASLAAGDQPLVVTVGGVASNVAVFTVRAAVLAAIAPPAGAAGSAVTVTGSGFGALQGASRLSVGGVDAAVAAWSDTSISATVPGTLGVGAQSVVAWVGGQPSNALTFTVSSAPAPVITNLSPAVASAGMDVVISGSGFGASQGASTVVFNGVALSATAWSNASVTVRIPASLTAAAGTLTLTAGGQASNAAAFTVVPALTGAAPQALYAGGQVTLSGSGFDASQGASSLVFGSSVVAPSAWSMTAVTFTVPAMAAADYFVRLVVGGQASNSTAVTVLAPPTPVISALSPASGPTGTSVTLTGANFGAVKGTSTLTVGGTGVTPTAWGATSIAFTVPALADGSHPVVVTVGGLTSNAAAFTVASPGAPALAGVTPAAGAAGTTLTVTGSALGAFQGASTLTLDGAPLTVLSWSDTSVVATVPASAAAGSRSLVATVAGRASNALTFAVRPLLTALTPATGPTGTSVVLSGAGFGASQGLAQVLVGGGTATVTAWSDTAITAVVPGALAPGGAAVSVVVGGQASNARTFTVTATAAPVLTAVTPAGASAGALVTVSGVGFGSTQGTSTISLGGTSVTPASWSDGAVTFTLSAAAAPGSAAIVVTAAGQASNPLSLAVLPAITAVSPSGGPAGTRITLTGTNLGAAAGALTVGGLAVVPAAWSASSVAFDVPVGLAAGSQPVVIAAGGQTSNTVYVTVTTVGAPALTSLTPATGLAGSLVTAAGLNFGDVRGASTVNFGATTAAVAAWSAASVSFTAPTLPPGSYQVTLTVGGQTSNALPFAVTAPASPVITSLTPASGGPGALVTVAGSAFGASQGGSTLALGGTLITPLSWSATSIAFVVPAGLAPGSLAVVVTVGGLASNAAAFTLRAATLASLTPASGPAGTTVTIRGADFGAVQGTSTLAIGGLAVAPLAWYGAVVTASVPGTLGAGAQPVVITVGGQGSNALDFTVTTVLPPLIESAAPVAGSGGALVTLAGQRFGVVQGTSTVTLGGTNVSVQTWSNTALTVRVPSALRAGAASFVVTVGGLASNAFAFTVTPTLISLTPPAGLAGVSVTLTGTNFGATQSGSSVSFGGSAATVTGWSASAVTFSVPGGASPGAAAVYVLVGGQPSNALDFTVTAPGVPAIASVSPASGPAGSSVVISGANFGATQGASTLTIGGATATVGVWSDTSITATVPGSLGAGAHDVVVTVGGQPSNTATFTVTVANAPSITAVSPNQGVAATLVTIAGLRFGATQGASTLSIGGTAVTALAWGDTSITAYVPGSLAPGLQPIVVTVSGVASNSVDFAVRPELTAIAPTGAPAGVTVVLTGANFGAVRGASSVTFGGAAAQVSAWSVASIEVTVPAAAPVGAAAVVVTVNGQPSNAAAFTVLSPTAPYVASSSPVSGPVGTVITLTGLHFGAVQGASTVSVGGVASTPSAWSDTSITLPAPAGFAVGPRSIVVTAGGEASNAAAFTVVPWMTAVTPAAASAGASVTLTGTSFGPSQGASTLTLAGVALAATAWYPGAVTFVVPAGVVAGTQTIALTVGGYAANAVTFGVQPSIAGIAPSSATVGTLVTITGTGFGAVQGGSTVTVGGVTAAVTAWSTVSVTFRIPILAAGDHGVVLAVAGQTVSTSLAVVPFVAARTPASGGTGTVITVTGTGFGAVQGASTLRLGGTVLPVSAWYPDAITATVAAAVTAGTQNLLVGVAGYASNALAFDVTPSLTGVSPASGSGGATLTLSGTGFGALQGASYVQVGGVPATVLSWSSTSVAVTLPDAVTGGTRPVTLTVGGYTVAQNVTVVPAITSLTPSTGSGGTAVTITGTNFGTSQGTSTVVVGGAVATVSAWAAGSITFTVPGDAVAGAAGVVVIVAGEPSAPAAFAVSPVLTGVAPASGVAGALVTLTGANLGAVAGTLALGGAPATVVSWYPTVVTASVPAGATAGTAYWVATVGGAPSNGIAFAVVPTLTAVTPAAGSGGTNVTLSGTNFGGAQGTSTVSLGGNVLTPLSWSSTAVGFAVPSTAVAGVQSVALSVGGQTASLNFTVLPAVTGVSPASVTGGAAVTVSGTNFGAAGTLRVGGVPIVPTTWSNAMISFALPTTLAAQTAASVSVTVNGVSGASGAVTVVPSLYALNVTGGNVGSQLVLTGANFGTAPPDAQVTFGAFPATVLSWTNTAVAVMVPYSLSTGWYAVQLSSGGQSTGTLPFWARATGFAVVSAETLDCDPIDGKLDHFRVTYNENVADATFEGYQLNNEGFVTTRWSVGGHANVRLHHGTNLPAACGADTANDAVEYLKFDPASAPNTGVRPELTAAAALIQASAAPTGRLVFGTGTFGTNELIETDKAGPYVYAAAAYEGGAPEAKVGPGDRLTVHYSESTTAPDFTGADYDNVFALSGGHDFGAPGDVTGSVWTQTVYAADTLTLFFASTLPTVAVADTIRAKGLAVKDSHGNAPAAAVAAPPAIGGSFEPGPVGPSITAADYEDLDRDGHLDHVKVTFSGAVNDLTFPGYFYNDLGTVTALWRVAGYTNVRMDDRFYLTGDALNDNVIYLAFDEHGTYDTGATPDLTATADVTQLRDAGGCYFNANNVGTTCSDSTKAVLTSNQVVEGDKAMPILTVATAKAGSDTLFLEFSENVWRNPGMPGCGTGGELTAASFHYGDVAAGNATRIAYMDTDACGAADALVVVRTDSVFAAADLGSDTVSRAVDGTIYDGAGNAMAAGVTTVIRPVSAPYLLAASSFKVGTKYYLRVVFSEPVQPADALTRANYAIQEDVATSCTDLAAQPVSVSEVTPGVYDLETAAQCGTTTTPRTYYRITVSNVRDADESAVITSPNVATTLGTDASDTTPPRLLLAEATSLTTLELIFSEPMLQGDVANSAECASTFTVGSTCSADVDGTVAGTQLKYTITPNLGTITSVVRTANPSVYVLTHSSSQRGLFYNLSAYATGAVAAIPKDQGAAGGNQLLGAPNNQATFKGLGSGVFSIDDGPLFDDPFGDGTTANFAFTYANRVYTGPNSTNSGAFRFEADGENPVAVSFLGPAAGACPYATSFGSGSTTCGPTSGPNNETGLVGFNAGSVTVGGLPYEILMVGEIKDKVSHLYFTQDLDTQLDWTQCALPTFTGGNNTKSIQNTFAFAGNLYAGISSAQGIQAPFLLQLPLTAAGGVLSCGAGTDLGLATLTNIGGGGSNPAVSQGGNNPIIGIDAMYYLPSSAGLTSADAFFIANNGGVSKSDGTPAGVASFSTVMAQSFFAGYDSTKSGDNVTLVIDSQLKVSPGRKGVPKFFVWKNTLFMARNVAVSQTYANQTVSAGGELWKCSANCTSSASWTRVFTTSSAGTGSVLESPNNTSISLLEVNGPYLYVGFDNLVDGARVYRTSLVPSSKDDFAETGRIATAACANHSGSKGALGGLCYAYQFLSSTSISKDGYNYLYVTLGCTLSTAIGDGQTCDTSAGAGVVLAPMKVLVQRD